MSLEQCLVDAIIDESVKTVFSTCHFLKLFPLGLCSPESEDFSLTSWKSSYTCWIISRFYALRFLGSIFRLLSSAFTMCVYLSSRLESMASLIWRRPKLKESKDFFFPPFQLRLVSYYLPWFSVHYWKDLFWIWITMVHTSI